jgi:adenylate cyclase
VRNLSKPGLAIGLGIGLLVLLLSLTPPSANLENQIFDLFMRWQADPAKWPKDVVLVLVDENAMRKMGEQKRGERWPWRRDAFAALTAYFMKADAKAVVFDILFCEEADPFFNDAFSTFIKAAGDRVVLSTQIKTDVPNLDPVEALREAVGPRFGFVNVEKDADGVIRRYFLTDIWKRSDCKPLALFLQDKLHFAVPRSNSLLLRHHANADQLIKREIALSTALPVLEGLEIYDAAMKGDKVDPTDLRHILDAIQQSPMPRECERFRDKIVLVGCSAQATFDPVATPLSGHQPGVLIQATALTNLMRGDYLIPAASILRGGFLFLAAIVVTTLCLCVTKIRWQVAFTVLVLAAAFGVSYACFSNNLWLPPLMAMVAGAGSFTGVTTWQYFTEGKQKRWMRQLFSDFVSPDVLEEIQQSPGGLNMRGDRRVGSVLFCDLAGFTTFTERAPPDQFIDSINAYLSEASQVLLARGAYIDKFIGDAVMAVFGVPKAQPDHALQACLSALELQAMLTQLNERLGKQYQLTLGMRVGVNSGEMITGPIGYARKLNYTVLGDTVNLASRLEGANKAFDTRIMIGPLTHEQAKDALEVRFLDYLRVKGKKKPVDVYEVMARKGGLTPQQESLRKVYLEGIEQYRQRKWKEAQATFERALTIAPEDGPSVEYRDRCVHYQKDPPLEDWDGSFGLEHK